MKQMHLAVMPGLSMPAGNILLRNFQTRKMSAAAAGTQMTRAQICPETIIEMTSFG